MFYTFQEISDKKIPFELVGKKAESLIRMTEWGFPVPDGGCVTTRGFDAFIQLNELEGKLEAIRHAVTAQKDDAVIDLLTDELCRAILQGDVPEDITAKVRHLQDRHPQSHFAVRSSGTKEDLQGASFAGQYTTILNVTSPEHIIAAVKQCWTSLFNSRVVQYCINKKIDFSDMSLSVCIQKMIPSEKSGVVFTVDPLKGFDKHILMEACFGIGEALVGGEVTPDQYVYDWFEETEVKRTIADKKISMIALSEPPFTRMVENSETQRKEAVLSKEDVKELAELCVKIQAKYGFPIDIEWARHGGKFYILQSRPITTITFTGIDGEWSTADFKDGGVSSTVCTPYMWSLYDLIWESAMPAYLKKVKMVKSDNGTVYGDMFFGRPYWNLTAVKNGLKKIPGFCERDFDNDLGVQITYEGDGYRTKITLKTIWHGLKVLLALKKSFKHQMAICPAFKASQQKKLEDLEHVDCEKMPRQEFFNYFETFISEEYFLSESTYFDHIFNSSNNNTLFKDEVGKIKGDINLLNLLSGLTTLSHLIPNYKLWDLKEKIRQTPECYDFWSQTSPPDLVDLWRKGETAYMMDEVRAYISEFKYHSTRELDIMVPRYGEDPTFVMETIKSLLDVDSAFAPKAMNEKQYNEYLKEREKLLSAVPFYKRKHMGGRLDEIRRFLWWREELRDYSTRYYDFVRKFTLVLARHFLDMKIINETDDIFFFSFSNMQDIIHERMSIDKARSVLRKNRLYYDGFRNFQNPNELGSRFTSSESSAPENGDVLSGIPCSQGIIKGKAKVIKDIFDADRLEKGDILITKFTDPGWTPKFGLLSGVATETGGLLSHAAVISREYGIPAVLAIDNVTRIIKDGDMISLDGNAGKIIIERA